MSAVQEARRGLIAAGFGATPDQERAHLAEIATYIGETDPLMIGAAWLLEQSGHERMQLSLLKGGRP